MVDYLTYANIGDQIANLIDDSDTDTRTVIDQVIYNVCRELIADISRSSRNVPPWLRNFDDTLATVAPATITGISAADPGVITTAAHGLSTSDIVSIYGITTGPTELNNRTFKVNSVPLSTTLSLIDLDSNDAIDTTLLTAWSVGGTVHHRGRLLNVTGANVERVLSAAWHGKQPPMKPITEEELEKSTMWWGDNTGQPMRYLHRKHYTSAGAENNMLLWFPAADAAYDLRYWFERRFVVPAATSEIPILPPWAHMALVWGSLIQLSMFDIRVKAGPWAVLYSTIVGQLKGYSNNFVTQGGVKPFAL